VKPRICVSIQPKTTPEALKLIEKAEAAGADLVEVRLDGLKRVENLSDLAKHGKASKIATNMPASLRGKFRGTQTEQKQTLLNAAKSGFDYVDIDVSTSNLKGFTTEAREHGAKMIVSFHDFSSSLSIADLNGVLEREIAGGADVCKIVTTAKRVEDNLTMLNFVAVVCKKTDVVCFAMGDIGKVSRLLSPLFGSFLTFAALERGSETAPGQLTIKEMRTTYKLLGFE
jgi:3-dehydroquinate dehydratase type I